MAYEFILPSLGENIKKADVTRVLVAVGDAVAADDAVVELETDKASLEVPIDRAGTVKSVHVKEGDSVAIGAVLLVLEEAPAKADDQPAAKTPAPAAAAPAKTEPAPAVSPDVKVEPATPAAPAPSAAPRVEVAVTAPAGTPAPAAPSVRRFAREIGIDINRVAGSGRGGRISVDDVKAHAKSLNTGKRVEVATQGVAMPPLPNFAQWGAIDVEPMSNVRRKTAEHMSLCWTTIPQVTQYDQADITELEALRHKHGPKAEKLGGKLTLTAILLKVVAAALKKFPQFCASVDMEGQTVIHKKYYHVGVAVDTQRGLIVPVIRDVDRKNILELSAELQDVAKRARDKKTTPDEMQGGCFTITNLGGIGGTSFSPIVNWPEVAILGAARGSQQPVWDGQQFVPRLILPLSLSYDHRVIDGADGARFLRWIAEALETPFLLPLEG